MATVQYAVRKPNSSAGKEVVPEIKFYPAVRHCATAKIPRIRESQRQAGKLECPRIDKFYLLAAKLLYYDTHGMRNRYSNGRWSRARATCVALRKVLLELRQDLLKLQKRRERETVDRVRAKHERLYRADEIAEMRERGLEAP